MYSNYQNIPMQYRSVAMKSLPLQQVPNGQYQDGDRFGFALPFLLGGVTGAALAPAFWRPGYGYGYNRPPYPYPPCYGPYCR